MKRKLFALFIALVTSIGLCWGQSSENGKLPGTFSVSSTKQVKFSAGNLQATYNGSSWTWAFAENQWDYIGNAAGNTNVTATSPFISNNGTVDLFGWVGASSTWDGVNQYGITSSSAINETNGYGNGATEGLKADWGGLIGYGWYTLTSDEWTYLLTTRSASTVGGTSNARYCKATVNSKAGLVIFPDSYTHPDGVTAPASINTTGAAFNSNSWSGADWTNMETAGCVFLPAAGRYNGTAIERVGSYCRYWTSTPSDATNALRLSVHSGNVTANSGEGRNDRLAVRLAIPVSAEADAVIALIEAIGEVTFSTESKDKITAAREAYDALTIDQKAQVSNYTTLTTAEDTYEALRPFAPITTAPAAVENLKYTGAAQALITAGEAEHGTLQYKLGADGMYGDDIPTATNVETYTVYYKVIAIDDYKDTEESSIEVSIGKADNTVTASIENWAYGATASTPTALATYGASSATFTYSDAADGVYTSDVPTSAGTYYVKAAIAESANYNAGVSDPVEFKINKATLTVTAEAKNITYGDADVALTYTVDGLVGTDAAENVLSGALARAAGTDAGTYAITQGTLAANDNYQISFTGANYVIGKATLTVTADAKNITYGDADVALTYTVSGIIEGDVEGEVLSGALARAAGTDANTYAITQGTLAANDNYQISFTGANYVIGKATLTVTADAKNITYGDADVALTYTVDGLVGTDVAENVLSGTLAREAGTDANTYAITQGTLAANDNYQISFTGANYVIGKAANTVTASIENWTYGATASTPTALATYDASSATFTYSDAADGVYTSDVPTSAGTYYVKAAIAESANYNAGVSDPVEFKINKATLTVTADAKNITYGDADVALTYAVSGFIGSDVAENVLSGALTRAAGTDAGTYAITQGTLAANDNYQIAFTGANYVIGKAANTINASIENWAYGATASTPTALATYGASTATFTYSDAADGVYTADVPTSAGTYYVKAAIAESTNYNAGVSDPVEFKINKATLTVTADAKNITYGDADVALTYTVDGLVGTDAAENVLSGALTRAAGTDAGTYAITQGTLAANDNYQISFTGANYVIGKATLTVTADAKSITYGDADVALTYAVSGFIGSDVAENVLSGAIARVAGTNAGTYAITQGTLAANDNYQIAFTGADYVIGKATVNVSDAEAQIAKFVDGNTSAVVLNEGTLSGLKFSDAVGLMTTAAFSDAAVGEGKTITLSYALTGDAALVANYDLAKTGEVFSTGGVIIDQFIPDNNPADKEDEEAAVNDGIEVYAYGYCEGGDYNLRYHLSSGNPDQYKIEFADDRFSDVDWTNLTSMGTDGTIDISIPVDIPTGEYTFTATFRDSRFPWLESNPFSVTFYINLPDTYVRPLFDNTIVLIDTCECFTDIQWYHRANSTDTWQIVPGATGYYVHVDGKLTGEYFVKAKMNGVQIYTCGQTDMETLYVAEAKSQAIVKVYPNPVSDVATVSISDSENSTHELRIVNINGIEMFRTTFDGDETVADMNSYAPGTYMVSVDGIVVKVIKQ